MGIEQTKYTIRFCTKRVNIREVGDRKFEGNMKDMIAFKTFDDTSNFYLVAPLIVCICKKKREKQNLLIDTLHNSKLSILSLSLSLTGSSRKSTKDTKFTVFFFTGRSRITAIQLKTLFYR